jgi:pimeloyl-ACP methyl ester carboxylesterase
VDALKDAYDVVAVDLRGQGRSETTEDQAAYDMWNQAEDVYGLIQELGLGPVHWVGLSMGGFIGMRLALTHPEAIRDMVLLDTQARPEDPERVERYDAFCEVVWDGQLEAVEPALPPIFFSDRFIAEHPDEVEAWLGFLRGGNHRGMVMATRGVNGRDDITDRLGEIGVPTLVLHGSEDAAIDVDRGEALAAGIPGARFELIDGAGHQSNVDTPDVVSQKIRAFLDQVRQGVAAG